MKSRRRTSSTSHTARDTGDILHQLMDPGKSRAEVADLRLTSANQVSMATAVAQQLQKKLFDENISETGEYEVVLLDPYHVSFWQSAMHIPYHPHQTITNNQRVMRLLHQRLLNCLDSATTLCISLYLPHDKTITEQSACYEIAAPKTVELPR